MTSSIDYEIPLRPIAKMLEIIGDQWTALIIADLFQGNKQYGKILKSVDGIATNILANRLQKLERQGIIIKTMYCEKPSRYSYGLTNKGKDLLPVIKSMYVWANIHTSVQALPS